jgi:putative transposase
MLLTYRYRVKSLQGELNRQARAVSYVWNYCADAQRHAVNWRQKWPSGIALNYMTAGAGPMLGLSASTINEICRIYAQSRAARPRLRYRGRKSLGWVPLRGQSLKWTDDGLRFAGRVYRVFKSRDLPPGARIKDGSNFSQDARGRWYLNLVIEVLEREARTPIKAVGIDLGLKELATLSTGETVANPRHLHALAAKLGKAQRARKKRLATNIHSRIHNARRDFLHKLSTRIVREFDFIAVGNVNAAGLAKTSMAKSVLDAGWSTLRNQLRYKAIGRGVGFEEVSEYLTTQTCSSCGCLPPERPKGIAGLGIRRWTCSECGVDHDRDLNAALNILARSGHRALVEGALAA